MNASYQDGVRRLRDAGRGQAGARSSRLVRALAVIAAGVVLVALAILWSGGRGIRAIPAQQRAALLSQTVAELRQFCGEDRLDALKDHCRELASFAARFDECTQECETLVRRELTPIPTR